MKKYNVCMPIELEFERRRDEIRLLNQNRRLQGLEPVEVNNPPSAAAESPQNDFEDDEPIPYKLTPLGCKVVENGLVVGEIHTVRELKSYDEWRKRMTKRANHSVDNKKKVDNQRKCQQMSIFEKERGEL